MKKETKKLIAAGIVMALSCGAWGSVSAQDCIKVTQESESKTITGDNIVFDKKTVVVPDSKSGITTSIYIKNGTVSVTADDAIRFNGLKTPTLNNTGTSDLAGREYNAGWLAGNATLNLKAKELYVGSVNAAKQGTGDDGFQMTGSNNYLNILANKIVSYTGDSFINAQDETRTGKSIVNIGTAEQRVRHFEAHTTWGKKDYGVAILQANEGNTVNLYADKVLLDGYTNLQGGVIGTGSYGTVKVDAKDLEIDGNICGTYGTVDYPGRTASLIIETDTLHMTGDVNIGSAGSESSNFSRKTEVNIQANTSAVIDGDINVAGNQSRDINDRNKKKDNTNDSSTLNITFNGDSKITGDINVKGSDADKDTQNVTVSLGGKGNMTTSKGVYNVNNNANVNFTGGQWSINAWNTEEGKNVGNAAVKSGVLSMSMGHL